MTAGDILFLDTNILLSATDESRGTHKAALSVFRSALEKRIHCGVSGQVLREYLVVATRPKKDNGFGMGVREALSNVEKIRRRTVFLEETEAVSERFLRIISSFAIKGKKIHDANIVATIEAHSVTYLLTENPDDFKQYSSVKTRTLGDFFR